MALVYNGEVIRDKGEMLSLTDMWRAGGSVANREPFNWARKEGAAFIEAVSISQNLPTGQVLKARQGRNGGTFAHWQIALAYAKYLSTEFHMWCNEVVRERMEGSTRAVIPADAAEQIERSFGIARMLSHKVTGLESTINTLAGQVQALVVANDPRRPYRTPPSQGEHYTGRAPPSRVETIARPHMDRGNSHECLARMQMHHAHGWMGNEREICGQSNPPKRLIFREPGDDASETLGT